MTLKWGFRTCQIVRRNGRKMSIKIRTNNLINFQKANKLGKIKYLNLRNIYDSKQHRDVFPSWLCKYDVSVLTIFWFISDSQEVKYYRMLVFGIIISQIYDLAWFYCYFCVILFIFSIQFEVSKETKELRIFLVDRLYFFRL